jgi:hypothetical protein
MPLEKRMSFDADCHSSQMCARARTLYTCYRKWAEPTGEEILTEKSFCTRLGERFLKEHREAGTFYKGIGLRREPTDGY